MTGLEPEEPWLAPAWTPTSGGRQVLAFDPTRTTNAQLMADCQVLGYLPQPVADVTYGHGRFWSYYRPDRLWVSDITPREAEVTQADFGALPYDDLSVRALTLDPPYKLTGTPAPRLVSMNDGYGVDRYRSPAEVLTMYRSGFTEAYRVLDQGGLLLVKFMDQIAGERLVRQSRWIERLAERKVTPMEVVDCLHVLGSSPRQEPQVHARNNFSSLMVLRKTSRPRGL